MIADPARLRGSRQNRTLPRRHSYE